MPKKLQPKRSALAASAGTVGPAPVVQVGALCWRRTRRGQLRVLLITSRDTGRWVIPKGWRMRRLSDFEAAAREAYEEAGVRGEVSDRSLGFFPYLKNFGHGRRALCLVRVYPLEVRQMLRNYPETGQRRIKWFALDKAAGKLDEPDLAAMVREFDPDGAAVAVAAPVTEPTA
jgi:8-oxo-dGTP pyrophosphatase MutT (NUDIX family)